MNGFSRAASASATISPQARRSLQQAIPSLCPLGSTSSKYSPARSSWLRSVIQRDTNRSLALVDGKLAYTGAARMIVSKAVISSGTWHHVAAVSNGARVTLYLDGRPAGGGASPAQKVPHRIAIAPPIDGRPHFGGTLVAAQADDAALDAGALRSMVAARPAFALVQLDEPGVGWPLQKSANIGLTHQQPAWTLPHGTGPDAKPGAKPVPNLPQLQPLADGRWQINGWRLAAAPEVHGGGAALSRADFDANRWYRGDRARHGARRRWSTAASIPTHITA